MYKLETCCLSSHPMSTKSLHLVLPTAFPDRNSKPRSSATDGGPDDVVADWGPKVTKLCPSLCHGNHITNLQQQRLRQKWRKWSPEFSRISEVQHTGDTFQTLPGRSERAFCEKHNLGICFFFSFSPIWSYFLHSDSVRVRW